MNIKIEDKKLTVDGTEIELGTNAKIEIEIVEGKPKLKITAKVVDVQPAPVVWPIPYYYPVYPNYPSIWTLPIQPPLPYTVTTTCQSSGVQSSTSFTGPPFDQNNCTLYLDSNNGDTPT